MIAVRALGRWDSQVTSGLAGCPDLEVIPGDETGQEMLSGLFDAGALHALIVAVILIGQELARHSDPDPITLGVRLALDIHVEVDGRHDAVAELLLVALI